MNLRLFLLALCFAFSIPLFSQNTTNDDFDTFLEYFSPAFTLNVGPQFPRNEDIKQQYNTTSTLFYGFGLLFGVQSDAKPNLYINYNHSSFKKLTQSSNSDTILKYNQYQIGFQTPFDLTKSIQPNLDFAINYGNVLNKYNSPDVETALGIKCGIQLNIKTPDNIYFFLGLNYNYFKTSGLSRNHDHLQMSTGIVLPFT